MGERRWAILCPGPSLAGVNHIEGRSVVAVNHAILFPGEIVNAWVVHDPPKNLWGRDDLHKQAISDKLAICNPQIWCSEAHSLAYGEAYPHCKVDPHERNAKKYLQKALGWEDVKVIGSLGIALAGAVFKGAKEVHIYGADMAGFSDFDPRTGEPLPNGRSETDWETRWAKERAWLEEAMAWLRENRGVQVVRW